MKNLNEFILEAAINRTKVDKQNIKKYFPKSRSELKEIIYELIMRRGIKADLNDIDTSKIDDMSNLFGWTNFNGDISDWDVSNVQYMDRMFANSKFNGDISKWNVKKVKDMRNMFKDSKFNGDISKWDVSNVKSMKNMFGGAEFNSDISNWKLNKECDTSYMFRLCCIKEEFKPKIE